MAIRVLIADDHDFMRNLLRELLQSHEDVELVGEAGDGYEAVSTAKRLAPDVVLMDVAMPGMNGVEATSQITKDHPGSRVVALSMHMSSQFVLDMAQAGAVGYVVKAFAYEELHDAIVSATSGRPYVSEGVFPDVAQKFRTVANTRLSGISHVEVPGGNGHGRTEGSDHPGN